MRCAEMIIMMGLSYVHKRTAWLISYARNESGKAVWLFNVKLSLLHAGDRQLQHFRYIFLA